MLSRNSFFLIALFIVIPAMAGSAFAQETKVNQKKIELERSKKQKKEKKDYDQAVKRHNKMQSKSTQASMKKTKKESKKRTPSKH